MPRARPIALGERVGLDDGRHGVLQLRATTARRAIQAASTCGPLVSTGQYPARLAEHGGGGPRGSRREGGGAQALRGEPGGDRRPARVPRDLWTVELRGLAEHHRIAQAAGSASRHATTVSLRSCAPRRRQAATISPLGAIASDGASPGTLPETLPAGPNVPPGGRTATAITPKRSSTVGTGEPRHATATVPSGASARSGKLDAAAGATARRGPKRRWPGALVR